MKVTGTRIHPYRSDERTRRLNAQKTAGRIQVVTVGHRWLTCWYDPTGGPAKTGAWREASHRSWDLAVAHALLVRAVFQMAAAVERINPSRVVGRRGGDAA